MLLDNNDGHCLATGNILLISGLGWWSEPAKLGQQGLAQPLW